jgi:tetratricopeptide (TPR) repeat protein/class 3 adenylate cyclase
MELELQAPFTEATVSDGQTMYRTVVVVDMVGYSTLARLLEENTGASAVAHLNRQIQVLIQGALATLPTETFHGKIAETGDGAILYFDFPHYAHLFSTQLHTLAREYNQSRTERSARRWFRIGIASGELSRTDLEQRSSFAGIVIANAVRLECAAHPGEIVMDAATFRVLPDPYCPVYSAESTIRGKRQEVFRVRRYQVIERPPAASVREIRISRRRMLGLSAGAAGLAAFGVWFKAPEIDRLMHPLPMKRFVALHIWPEPEKEVVAVLNRIVASIQDRLTRAEPHDRQFVVFFPGDPLLRSSGPPLPGMTLSALANALGANLVLAATSKRVGDRLRFSLQLLDPSSGHLLRHRDLTTAMKEISSFNMVAAEAAAALLDLPTGERQLADEEETGEMSPEAYQLLAEGRRLIEEPNGVGLDNGIEKLQQLVNNNPRFAVGYAELAHAYLAKYAVVRDSAILELVRENAQRALRLNPDSARAMLAQAKYDVDTGQVDSALTQIAALLKLDPLNPEALLYKAYLYRTLNRLQEEEAVYRQIATNRPNYWLAYNELGFVLKREANYRDAIQAFSTASQIAPKVAMPLTNLGMLYLETGQNAQGKETLEHSITLYPDPNAYVGLGDLAFEAGDFKQAIPRYSKAHELRPTDHSILRDLGDCYTTLNQPDKSREAFTRAAAQLAGDLDVNSRSGANWMVLSFYHAKMGDFTRAQHDIETAEQRGANDVESQLTKAQTLAVMGRREDALRLVLNCLDRGISPANVALAVDLKDVRNDPRYRVRTEHPSPAAS